MHGDTVPPAGDGMARTLSHESGEVEGDQTSKRSNFGFTLELS